MQQRSRGILTVPYELFEGIVLTRILDHLMLQIAIADG